MDGDDLGLPREWRVLEADRDDSFSATSCVLNLYGRDRMDLYGGNHSDLGTRGRWHVDQYDGMCDESNQKVALRPSP